jgi:cell division protein FtsB
VNELLSPGTLQALAPSIAIAVVGFFLKRLISEVEKSIASLAAKVDALQALVGSHQTDLRELTVRVGVLEHEVERLRSKAA